MSSLEFNLARIEAMGKRIKELEVALDEAIELLEKSSDNVDRFVFEANRELKK